MAYSGKYRGVTFRSLLELSVIMNLEAAGLELGATMLYEATRIPYGRGGKRTYVVDLTLPRTRTLVEVKPSSKTGNRNNTAKRKAAEAWCRANGWTYLFVTEEELRAVGVVFTLEEAAQMPDVVLNEKAMRAARRKAAARKRKARKKR